MKNLLEDRLYKLESEYKNLKAVKSEAERKIVEKQVEIKKVQKQLWDYDHSGELKITDHAMVRYLQRRQILHIDDLREELRGIVQNRFVNTVVPDGDHLCGEFTARVVNNTVVTIF